MRVRRITGRGFMGYSELDLELCDAGIVLVTGPNGAGKSAIIEAPCAAVWNKTLRGTPWWRPGEECAIALEVPDTRINRLRTKSDKNRLSWERDGAAREFDSAAKAQEVLERGFPAFEVWRKTCVFTAKQIEGAQFTTSKDSARKRLIESVLGLDRFDPALRAARADLKEKQASLAELENRREVADTKYHAEEQRAKDAAESRKALSDANKPPTGIEELAAEIKELQAELRTLQDKRDELKQADAESRAEAARRRRQLQAIESVDECELCAQKIGKKHVAHVEQLLQRAEEEAAKAREAAKAKLDAIEAEIAETEDVIGDLRDERARKQAEEQAHRRMLAESARLDDIIAKAKMASTRYLLERTEGAAKINDLRREVARLSAVEHVLGLKGVRAHVLGDMIAGLNEIANVWLARMGDIRINVAPYRQKADKSYADDIELTITGAGGGYGYEACSTGQQRRIDVCLLLALAQVSQEAHGADGSTVFFDEVFDSLDAEGVRLVSEALRSLASDRCVVVISHAEHVRDLLEPTMHLQVEAGEVFTI